MVFSVSLGVWWIETVYFFRDSKEEALDVPPLANGSTEGDSTTLLDEEADVDGVDRNRYVARIRRHSLPSTGVESEKSLVQHRILIGADDAGSRNEDVANRLRNLRAVMQRIQSFYRVMDILFC